MAKTSSTTPTTPEVDHANAGKGRPTPTRREKEAARKRPLVSSDRREARRQARVQANIDREKARVGLANGDEKYLPLRDRGPQKKYVRDYVDARFSVGELILPAMFIVIIFTFVPSADVQFYTLIGIWAYFAIAVLDVVIMGFLLQRKLAAKFGAAKVERFRWYAAMRALQLRAMRLPKPQVKRGQFPV